MKLEELKKLREEKFLAHKKKKREYYLNKKEVKKIYDYEEELNNQNFASKIKEIIKAQKNYLDNRKDIIISKLNDYKNKKKEYYELNKEKRLEYDKEYREKKKEELKEYRKEYYKKLEYTLTKGGLKRKGKILKNSMVNLPTAVNQYVTNYIGIMGQFGFSGDLINRVKNLDNYKILLFSTFNASTIEYLYYEEPIKDKENVINQALDDVEQMISDYESNGDIEQMKSEIAKKKFKKYGVVN